MAPTHSTPQLTVECARGYLTVISKSRSASRCPQVQLSARMVGIPIIAHFYMGGAPLLSCWLSSTVCTHCATRFVSLFSYSWITGWCCNTESDSYYRSVNTWYYNNKGTCQRRGCLYQVITSRVAFWMGGTLVYES